MSDFVQLFFNGLVTGSILAIAAVGVSIVYGVLKLVNFAAGDFLTLGAFVTVVLSVDHHVPFIVAILIAMLTIAAISVVLEFALWRGLRRSKAGTLSLFLVATGVSLIVRQLILIFFGVGSRKFDIDVVRTFQFLGAQIAYSQLVVLVFASATILLLGLLIAKSPLGKGMRAYSDNPSLASVAGVNVDRIIMATWLVSGLLTGLAGVFQGMVQGSFESTMGWMLLLPIFAAVVLGTIGDAYGALIGGFVLGLVMELSTWHVLFGGVPASYKPVVAFGTLALVLLVKPEGLLGYKARSI